MPDLEKPSAVVPDTDLTVDLTPKPVEKTPEQKAKDTESQYLERLQLIQNQVNAANRQNEYLRRQVETLTARLTTPAPVTEAPPAPVPKLNEDFWTQVDPRAKEEVARLAQEQAQAILQRHEAERQVQEATARHQQVLEAEKKKVYTAYPQLNPLTGNEEDPFSQIYIQVVGEHPEWHHNELGPTRALQEALEVAKAQGLDVKSVAPQERLAPNQEVVRRTRASSTSLPPSRSVAENKVVLTADERAFCERHNIPLETFAKQKQLSEQSAGVEA